jgi:two-component system NtrC family sensor kinase
VFDAILASAVRLLGAFSGALTRVAGDQIELAALTRIDDARDAATRAAFPHPLQSEDPHAQAIRERTPLNIADAHTDPRLPEGQRAAARVRGFRSWVVVPMLRHDEAVGTIAVTRREPGGFTDDEIALLQTFADQAIIAVENVRLFNEIKEALAQQTATSEVLKVISRATFKLEPVLETLIENATRLCGADRGQVYKAEGEVLRSATAYGLALSRATPAPDRPQFHGGPRRTRTSNHSFLGRAR